MVELSLLVQSIVLKSCMHCNSCAFTIVYIVTTLRLFVMSFVMCYAFVMCLHCITLCVLPVLCACIVMFHLPINVGSESPGRLGAGLRRTGGWGLAY